jgi:hypothetical protein
MDSPTPREVVYAIDELDRIRWVNDDWDLFATANDSPAARSSVVLGTVLWDHVSDLSPFSISCAGSSRRYALPGARWCSPADVTG